MDEFNAHFAEVLRTYAGSREDRVNAAISHLLNDEVVLGSKPTQMLVGDAVLDGMSLRFDPQKLPRTLMAMVDEFGGQLGVGQEIANGLELDPNGPKVSLTEIVKWLGAELEVYPLADAGPGVLPLLLVFTPESQREIENLLEKTMQKAAMGTAWLYFPPGTEDQPAEQRLVIASSFNTHMLGPLSYVQRALKLEP